VRAARFSNIIGGRDGIIGSRDGSGLDAVSAGGPGPAALTEMS
jgi:hypothetical protein